MPHFAHFITETSVLFFVSAVEATAEATDATDTEAEPTAEAEETVEPEETTEG